MRRFGIAALVGLLLTACGGPAGLPAAAPPAKTAVATPAPRPTAAPSPDQLIAKLKAAGLPIGQVQDYTAATDANHLLGRPNQYIAKANFEDTRLQPSGFDVSGGGSIETFSSLSNLDTRAKYMATIAKSPLFAEYDYGSPSGLFLLRLGSKLTPQQGDGYVSALKGGYPDLAAVSAS